MTSKHALVCIAKIQGPHGIHGHVKVLSFLEHPKDLCKYSTLQDMKRNQSFQVDSIRPAKGKSFIVAFDSIKDRTQAESLKGTSLGVTASSLPKIQNPNEFYVRDMVGVKVYENPYQQQIGFIKAVHNFGAGDLLEIQLNHHDASILIPFSDHWIQDIDIENTTVNLAQGTLKSFVDVQNKETPTCRSQPCDSGESI